jgi:cell wall-associated NlpC family hydrolase
VSAGSRIGAGVIALLLCIPLLLVFAFMPAPDPCADATGPTDSAPVAGIPAPHGAGQQHAAHPTAGPVPARILSIYQQTGGALWPLLAGIGWEETRHGAGIATSSAGAEGFMQFEPATWVAYGQDGDPNDPNAAIPAAWRYLTSAGPLTSEAAIRNALFRYNHADWYVDDVLWWATQYGHQYGGTENPAGAMAMPAVQNAVVGSCAADAITTRSSAPTATGGSALVSNALTFLGTSYVWGGSEPGGFDCSGFTSWVYAHAGLVEIPRTAAGQQAWAVPTSSPRPGDLVFFGTPAYHVGIYVGDGQMVDAPHTGTVIRVEKVWSDAAGFGRART